MSDGWLAKSKYYLFNKISAIEFTDACLDSGLITTGDNASNYSWFLLYFVFRTFKELIDQITFIQQLRLLYNEEKCVRIYNQFHDSSKFWPIKRNPLEKFEWEDALEIIEHQKSVCRLEIVKSAFSFFYDCLLMYFLLPAIVWGGELVIANRMEWCDSDWGWNM